MSPNDTQIFKQTSYWQKELQKEPIFKTPSCKSKIKGIWKMANSVTTLAAAFLKAAHAQKNAYSEFKKIGLRRTNTVAIGPNNIMFLF